MQRERWLGSVLTAEAAIPALMDTLNDENRYVRFPCDVCVETDRHT